MTDSFEQGQGSDSRSKGSKGSQFNPAMSRQRKSNKILAALGLTLTTFSLIYFLLLSVVAHGLTDALQLKSVFDFHFAYQMGEFTAFMGVIGICIPVILQLNPPEPEIIRGSHLTTILILLIILGMAYTVRSPVPVNTPQDFTVFAQLTQLQWAGGIGLITTLLTFAALRGIAPRTLIILLLCYYGFFTSGLLIFNQNMLVDQTALLLQLLFSGFVLLLGILTIAKQTPNFEKEEEENEQLGELTKRFKMEQQRMQQTYDNQKKRFTHLNKSGVSRRSMGGGGHSARQDFDSDGFGLDEFDSFSSPSSQPQLSQQSRSTSQSDSFDAVPPAATSKRSKPQDLDESVTDVKKLREEIDSLRNTHQQAETAHHEKNIALLEQTQREIQKLLLMTEIDEYD